MSFSSYDMKHFGLCLGVVREHACGVWGFFQLTWTSSVPLISKMTWHPFIIRWLNIIYIYTYILILIMNKYFNHLLYPKLFDIWICLNPDGFQGHPSFSHLQQTKQCVLSTMGSCLLALGLDRLSVYFISLQNHNWSAQQTIMIN